MNEIQERLRKIYACSHKKYKPKTMKIFLDDVRDPEECSQYMGSLAKEYLKEGWVIARNYTEFKSILNDNIEKITHISFDHDLAKGHYHKNMQEGNINYDSDDFNDDANKTGYHAAKYTKWIYAEYNKRLPIMYVHSMNPVGKQNIINVFK